MAFKIDGFNERFNYIQNANGLNKLKKNGPSNVDSSFAKMKSEERKNIVETVNHDMTNYQNQTIGNRDNFVVRNNAISNANKKPMPNNPIMQAMNKNMFKK